MPSTPKVFGLGLSRTGTTSLHQALLRLGYRSVHYPMDPVTQRQLLEGDFQLKLLEQIDAVCDIPIVPFFRSFDRLYPGSRFILTVRALEEWLDSTERYWRRHPIVNALDSRVPARLATYGILGFNRERFTDVYLQHQDVVRAYFRGRERDLLELNICAGEGWEPLCRFLERPIPPEPFPRANVDPDKQAAREG